MIIDRTAIPHALTDRSQWIVWKYAPRDGDGKPTKIPYQAKHPDRKASTTGPRTWASFEQAYQAYTQKLCDGIGYVFSPDDPFAGFDLDGCLDDRGTVVDWAQQWLDRLDTYIEISPSEHGLKGIVIGRLPGSGINARGIEIYDQGRYFAITGRRWPHKPEEPCDINGTLDQLYAYAQQRKAQMETEREAARQRAYAESALRDEIAKLRSTTEGDRNTQLNLSAYALGQLVAGGLLSEQEVTEALRSAASAIGLSTSEISSTIRSGMQSGKREKRDIPPPRRTTDYIPVPTEQPESVLLIEKLKILGYDFRLNLCSDTIEVNGKPLDDILMAELRMRLRDIGLPKKIKAAEDAYMFAARQAAYHPIRDYLDGLKWDGENHIGFLTTHLESRDPPIVYRDGTSVPLHHIYIYRWLIGAVDKVYTGCQNMMLVLDGSQGIGKSTLVAWICPLPGFFIESSINVADKDNDLRLLTNWIWEVSELDATTRRADQSAIKSFITKQIVTVRKSYGRHDTKKPAMCSLIGTVNDTSGFLADESGSRRFMITKIDYIDLAYQRIDVHQIWAQALALYKEGHKGKLTHEEALHQQRQNERYEVATVLDDYIGKHFLFDPSFDDPISIGDIVSMLALKEIRLSGSERSQAMEIARIIHRRGARKKHTGHGNRWIGIAAAHIDD